MAQREQTAAGQIWPHLKTGEPPEQQQRAQSLAAALYPPPTPQAKAREAARSSQRDALLRNLRDLNERIDKRLRREERR